MAYQELTLDVAASGNTTLIVGDVARTIRVYGLFFVVASAVDVKFLDGATAMTGPMAMSGNGSFALEPSSEPTLEPWFTATVGNDFKINLSAAVQLSGRLYYTQV
jgi:hypothetical protein